MCDGVNLIPSASNITGMVKKSDIMVIMEKRLMLSRDSCSKADFQWEISLEKLKQVKQVRKVGDRSKKLLYATGLLILWSLQPAIHSILRQVVKYRNLHGEIKQFVSQVCEYLFLAHDFFAQHISWLIGQVRSHGTPKSNPAWTDKQLICMNDCHLLLPFTESNRCKLKDEN